MDKVYIVETTHENGEKEQREVEATHIIEAFQKGISYDPYATMVIVKEKVSRDYKAEIAYLTAENERLRGEVEEQKSIAAHEHAAQMEWFSIAGDYKAENTELRARLEKAVELPCVIGETVYKVIKNCVRCQHYNAGWAECRAPATANFDCESTHGICFTQDIIEDECKKHLYIAELKFDLGFLGPQTGKLLPHYFTDREAAEARLAEILEEK